MKPLNIAILFSLSSLFMATPAFAQESEREGVVFRQESDDDLRLREWLQLRAQGSNRTLSIVGGFGLAGAMTGLGIYGAVDSDQLMGPLSRMYIAFGVASLATPIVLLATQNHPQLDLENLPERALTEREIGYYEGLLHGEARLGRAMRIGRGIQGGFTAVAAGIGFGLTLGDGGFRDSPIEAGLYLGLGIGGLISAVSAFFKTRPERIWEGYQAGVVPQAETARIHFQGNSVELTF